MTDVLVNTLYKQLNKFIKDLNNNPNAEYLEHIFIEPATKYKDELYLIKEYYEKEYILKTDYEKKNYESIYKKRVKDIQKKFKNLYTRYIYMFSLF